jgi:UDP-2,3-diacylglucosamine hydrolase
MAGPSPSPLAGSRALLYIVGDIHLVDGGGPFVGFLERLALGPPARLVILGDLFEYWLETAACVARYAPVLERLRRLADAGWRLDLVRGNRELAAGRMLEVASGCRLHWPRLDVVVGGTRLRIVHGDRLMRDPGYRLFAAWLSSFWHRAWQAAVPAGLQDLIARMLRRRSQASQARRTRQGRRPFIDARRVAAAGRGCDVLIAGHVHESWRRRLRGVDLILVGDWPPGHGHWIEVAADGQPTRHRCAFPG